VALSDIAGESAKGSFALILGNALSAILSAIAVILIARLLGPSAYGVYSLAFVIPSIFVSLADFGISPALTRFTASLRAEQKTHKAASMITSAILFTILASAAAFAVAYGTAGPLASIVLHRTDIGFLVAAASTLILFQGLWSLSYYGLVGLDKMDRSATMTVLRDLVKMALCPVLIIAGYGILGAAAGQIAAWAFPGFLGVYLLFQSRRKLSNAGEALTINAFKEDIRTMTRFGIPLYLGSLFGTMFNQYQTIVLAFFTSNAEIGNFEAALSFGTLISIVAAPVTLAIFPAFSKLDLRTRTQDLQTMFEHSVTYMTLLIVPVAVLVATLSGDLTRVLFGNAYTSAPILLSLYAAVYLFTAIGYQANTAFLAGVGKTKDSLKVAVAQTASFLPLAPLMTWLFHAPGLLFALLLSTFMSTTFGLFLVHRYGMKVNLKASAGALIASLIAALPIMPIVHLSPLPRIVNVLLAAIIYLPVYITLAPLCGALEFADIEVLGAILTKVRGLRPFVSVVLAHENRVLRLRGRLGKSSRPVP
jgi:O-antigen/teichoic acid export membrane protein